VGIALREPELPAAFDGTFAEPSDYAICRRLHRKHGATYYFATRRFRPEIRRRTHALYGFVRVPDEWVDNPAGLSLEQRVNLLRGWRTQLLQGMDGVPPIHPVMRAFCDVVRETGMPLEEPLAFLDAMELDLSIGRYETFGDLRGYMRGSAAAVGIMMCHIVGARMTPQVEKAACSLGEAMQLTNFLRDVGEDVRRSRIYLPLEDLASFDVAERDILSQRITPQFCNLIRFQIARARALYKEADKGIPLLPAESRKAVLLARVLYARILDKIEEREFDVFSGRARTGRLEKVFTAMRIMWGKTR
jgi:15-cis-phytoene synthase